MKDQLLLLLRLQSIDSRVKELQGTIDELPRQLASDREALAKLEALIEAEKARFTETDSWRKEQERLIEVEEEALRKAKLKLQAAKGPKDYAAANREIDNKRRSKSERESEVLKVMEALEKFRADIERHEAEVGKLREHVSGEETRIAKRIEELKREAGERAQGREEVAGALEANVLKRYEYVSKRRMVALASVKNGVCQGCHMAIPPQLNNELARHDSVHTCPRCQRIIYRQELLDELQGDGDAAAP